MNRLFSLGLCLALSLGVISSAHGLKVGDDAPEVPMKMIKGEEPSMTSNRVQVIEFWRTECDPCEMSISHLSQIQQYYRKDRVLVVGVCSGENESVVREYVANDGRGMKYAVALDEGRLITIAYGIKSLPRAYVVDRFGKIAWRGHPSDPEMSKTIERLVRPPSKYPSSKQRRTGAPQSGMGQRPRAAIRPTPPVASESQRSSEINFLPKSSSSKGINFSWSDE